MAITRAQQAKQMLRKGGRIGLKGGADASMADFGTPSTPGVSKGRTGPGPAVGAGGASFNRDDNFQTLSTIDKDVRDRQKKNYEQQFFDKGKVPPLGSRPTSFKTKLNQRNLQKRLNYINYLQRQINKKLQTGLMDPSIPGVDVMTEEELLDLAPSVQDLVAKGFYSKDGPFAKGEKIPDFPSMNMPGVLGIAQGIFAGPVTSDKLKQLSRQLTTLEGLKTLEGLEGTTLKDLMKEYQPNRFELEYGDSKDDRGPSDPCKGPNPPAYCFIGDKADDTQEAAVTRNLAGLTPRIGGSIFNFDNMADGGIAGMDREAFLLGGIAKGLKKATRAVKKIVKSPIGKAALIGAGLGFAGIGPFKGLAGSKFGLGLRNFMAFGNPDKAFDITGTGFKLGQFIADNPYKTIGGLSLLAPLLAGKTEEEKDDFLKDYYAQSLTPSQSIRGMGSEFDFYGGERMRVADGGDVEPVAKKTMPLIDMDGKEKDYRETGGFVDMGRMERADDVPARLSKNEFVFTADAVRNAGEGDIDKGAEVMYNMMKNLEAGGEVSEESQGLEGARKMFQTSQRLGEVI